MKQPKTIESACDLLISRVRYERAGLSLPKGDGTPHTSSEEDTQAIRDATSLYVETWIVPMLQAIKEGDLKTLQRSL